MKNIIEAVKILLKEKPFIAAVAALVVIFIIYEAWPGKIMLQGEVVIRQLNISPKVTGRVNKINVSEGDQVKKGDVIATLDSPELFAKAAQAAAAERAASAEYQKTETGSRAEEIAAAYATWQKAEVTAILDRKEAARMKKLFAADMVASQDYDEAQVKADAADKDAETAKKQYDLMAEGNRVEDKDAAQALADQARGAVTEAQSYVDETTVTAPRDGEISSIITEEGEVVGAGLPVVTLLDLNDAWVAFNVREDLLPKIKEGDTVKIKIPALGGTYKFRIYYISKYGDFAVWSATKIRGEFDMKTFEVRARPAEKIDGLREGMSALLYL
ncbi:MAG: efflux RND transporter periplasmic adaptor subunit [Elusimicrobia bacterium]|nr:efflux RND transporter periplasmic adaptor subunit [Elusimicrobiota bacterium]